ncbi:hypothetical protein [Chondrinema litorale]|uniref:hypothetical protein n=1 Tax=Chondrinema litorale TaxID=2994555 RepID=UPI002542716B|nr:hypothetical protein [Chondrinema litorale]UZR99959.1 hypothetical protein OQ292_39400 [Chondrinema litorale]
MSAKNIFMSVLTGITTGTIMGVILTSKKGVIFRKKIYVKSNQFAEVQLENFNKLLNGFSTKLDKNIKKVIRESEKTNDLSDFTKKEQWPENFKSHTDTRK